MSKDGKDDLADLEAMRRAEWANVLRRGEHLLVALAKEMREGRGEGEVADRLRDELEVPMRMCTRDERALLDDLSEDLYLIAGERRVEPMDDGQTPKDVIRALTPAFYDSDQRAILHLLRKVPAGAWPDAIFALSYARCWEVLGFEEAAEAFRGMWLKREP